MSVSVVFYKCSCTDEVIDKTNYLTVLDTLSGQYRGEVNILSPVIRISPTTNATLAKLLTECNYCYIADLGRYYYVNDITAVANNVIEMRLTVDVLHSWRTAIKAQKVIVSRNQKDYNAYLDDPALKVYNNPNITVYNFIYDVQGTPTVAKFSNFNYVLAIAGS